MTLQLYSVCAIGRMKHPMHRRGRGTSGKEPCLLPAACCLESLVGGLNRTSVLKAVLVRTRAVSW